LGNWRFVTVVLSISALLFGNAAGWMHVGCQASGDRCCSFRAEIADSRAASHCACPHQHDETRGHESAEAVASPAALQHLDVQSDRSRNNWRADRVRQTSDDRCDGPAWPASRGEEESPIDSNGDERAPNKHDPEEHGPEEHDPEEHDPESCSVCQNFFASRQMVVFSDSGPDWALVLTFQPYRVEDFAVPVSDRTFCYSVRGPPANFSRDLQIPVSPLVIEPAVTS